MTDHHDDFNAGDDPVPALDGIECAFVIDPTLAADDVVDTEPHLSLLGRLLLDDHVDIRIEEAPEPLTLQIDEGIGFAHLVGPDGWLAGLEGRWVGVAQREGEVQWRALGEEATTDNDVVATVRDAFATLTAEDAEDGSETEDDDGPTVATGKLLTTAVASAPDLWRRASPIPVADVLAAAELSVHGFWVGDPTVDWRSFDRRQLRNRLVLIHDLDDQQAETALEILDTLADGTPDRTNRAIEALDDLAVAGAVRDELSANRNDDHAAGVKALIHRAEADSSALNAGAAWVAASILTEDAHPDRALAVLEPSLEALARPSTHDDAETNDGPTLTDAHGPIIQDLAILKADADELAEAHALFHVAETLIGDDGNDRDDGDDPYWFRRAFFETTCDIAELLSRSYPRNGPCPCGSGRKYKACHRGQALLNQSDRAVWIYRRVEDFAYRELSDTAVEAVGATLGPAIFSPDHRLHEHSVEVVQTWMTSPIYRDAVLFGHGGLAAYVHRRRAVLSDADRRILDAWRQTPLRLFTVTDTGRTSIDVTDRLSGETITVDHLEASTVADRGRIMLGRPLPAGTSHRGFHGFVPVDGDDMDSVMEALSAGDEAAARAVAAQRFLTGCEERLDRLRNPGNPLVLPAHD